VVASVKLRLSVFFRRRMGPLLFRAGGPEPCLLLAPPLPRLTALSRRPPWSLLKASSLVDGWTPCCSRIKGREPYVLPFAPLPRFIADGRWVPWPAGDLVAPFRARGQSCHGFHSSRQAQLALSLLYGLEGRASDRGASGNAASTRGAGGGQSVCLCVSVCVFVCLCVLVFSCSSSPECVRV
jgi:hypothetical protein